MVLLDLHRLGLSFLPVTSPLRSVDKLNLVFWRDGRFGLDLLFQQALRSADEDEGGDNGLGVSRWHGHPLAGDKYCSLEGEGLNRLEALVTAMVGFSTNRKDGNIAYNENDQCQEYLAILATVVNCQQSH